MSCLGFELETSGSLVVAFMTTYVMATSPILHSYSTISTYLMHRMLSLMLSFLVRVVNEHVKHGSILYACAPKTGCYHIHQLGGF